MSCKQVVVMARLDHGNGHTMRHTTLWVIIGAGYEFVFASLRHLGHALPAARDANCQIIVSNCTTMKRLRQNHLVLMDYLGS